MFADFLASGPHDEEVSRWDEDFDTLLQGHAKRCARARMKVIAGGDTKKR
jgi:hypothetical protein